MANVKMYRIEGGIVKTANVLDSDVENWRSTGGWLECEQDDIEAEIIDRRSVDIPVDIERRGV